MSMQLGMIGLGRMGANMVTRLIAGGHECVVFDLNPENVKSLEEKGARGASSLKDLIDQLKPPRIVWIMVPSGEATEKTIHSLAEHLEPGDVVIDGGNSHYKDDLRRSAFLAEKKIHFVDVGTSGGTWGAERGYCLMYGGERDIVQRLEPIFKTLAPGRGEISRTEGREKKKSTAEEGYLYCGPAGAGHFVKMIHNGIEYGLMQAYAEGFDILKNATQFDFDFSDIAEVWRRGSVVSSWLLDLTAQALLEDPDLSNYTGIVADSGEGRWTIQAAMDEEVPADVLSAALYARFRSRQQHTFAEKILSAMREKFGGHLEKNVVE